MALGNFCLICAVHLWVILPVIILTKQFYFRQLNYIILGHFPCGHSFFNVLTCGTILLCLGFLIIIDSVLKSDIPILQKSDLKVYLGSHINVHPSLYMVLNTIPAEMLIYKYILGIYPKKIIQIIHISFLYGITIATDFKSL